MALAAHTAGQREFIVRKLAAFWPVQDIVAAFRTAFRDTACTENEVLATDPRLTVVSPELYELFQSERTRVLDDPTLAPYADQRARLIVLSRQVERYESNNQPAEARAVLLQIAGETGALGGKAGAFPKSGTDAGPVVSITRTIIDPVASATPETQPSE
jgi:hypothetical protein